MLTEVPDQTSKLELKDFDNSDHRIALKVSAEILFKQHVENADNSNNRSELFHHQQENISAIKNVKREFGKSYSKSNLYTSSNDSPMLKKYDDGIRKTKVLENLDKNRSEHMKEKRYREWALVNKHNSIKDQIKTKVGTLTLPPSFISSLPTDIPIDKFNTYKPENKLQNTLNQFPGGLSMNTTTAKNYFGLNARDAFFDKQKYIQHKLDVTQIIRPYTAQSISPSKDAANSFLYESHLSDAVEGEQGLDHPFKPVRGTGDLFYFVVFNIIFF